MTEETRRLVEQAVAVLKSAGAHEVYLFGSAARGVARPDSDIDLAVSGLPPERFFHAMGLVLKAIGRPLDLIDLDQDTAFVKFLREHGELRLVG
jgi:predicted nucleotidyltransferase